MPSRIFIWAVVEKLEQARAHLQDAEQVQAVSERVIASLISRVDALLGNRDVLRARTARPEIANLALEIQAIANALRKEDLSSAHRLAANRLELAAKCCSDAS
jgi:hypothetical protein